MQNINSERKSLKKIEQLSYKRFVSFMQDLYSCMTDNKLDMNKIYVTEKSDGTALRLVVMNNELYFESSHSGIVTYDKMPFKNQAKWMYENLKTPLLNIRNKIGFDFKIICELIWCQDMVTNGYVVPVCTPYLAEKFGKFGGIIILDLLKIENNNLFELSESEYIKLENALKASSNNDFIYYSKYKDLTYTFELDFSMFNNLKDVLDELSCTPEKRWSPVSDFKLRKLRIYVIEKCYEFINNVHGHFNKPGDIIEGLVFTIKSSGNEYGIFSDKYKEVKEQYWLYNNQLENNFKQFLYKVFGYKQIHAVRNHFYNGLEEKLNDELLKTSWEEYKKQYKQILIDLYEDVLIPKSIKIQQLEVLESNYNVIKKINSVSNWIVYHIWKEEING
jgi:hypothetical protein